MSARNFFEMLKAKWAEGKFVCVGLDSEFSKIPEFGKIPESTRWESNEYYPSASNAVLTFNRAIVEATKDLVCAYKPNIAFYEMNGHEGLSVLQRTILSIRSIAPDVPVILDAKRGDIGNTNAGYMKMAFEYLNADAITVNPYLGGEALQPFLDCADKGIFVLCRTSNPGAGEFQDLYIRRHGELPYQSDGELLYQFVACRVASDEWNKNNNCALVVGATYPDELHVVREIVGDMPILIPGIGAQGGDLEASVKAGINSKGEGIIINSSRDIIFASKGDDFPEVARRETEKLHNAINECLKKREVNV